MVIALDELARCIKQGMFFLFGYVASGIDLAGPENHNIELNNSDVIKYSNLFEKAKNAGLKTTVHTGETKHTSGEGVIAALKHLKPDRIGHGIRAAYNKLALQMLSDAGVVLEICPSSNLQTHAVENIKELKLIITRLKISKVPFTINTDGPYLLNTHLAHEALLLLDANILTEAEIKKCFDTARAASFIQ